MKKIKSIQALTACFSLLLFVVACTNNNSGTTKSSAFDSTNGSNASSATTSPDTSVSTANKTTRDSGMTSLPKEFKRTMPNKTMTAKKKGKATVGSIVGRERAVQKMTSFKPDRSGVYDMTEVGPAYPGGQNALESYISNHIEYPQMAIDDNKEGTVSVQFVVSENGEVRDAKVIGSKLGDGLDEEAERVISQMPNWTAGKVKGKSVKTRVTLPITYKIEE